MPMERGFSDTRQTVDSDVITGVVTVVMVSVIAVWKGTLCSLLLRGKCFGETWRFHLHSIAFILKKGSAFLVNKTNTCTKFQFYWYVSGSLSAHHQEFLAVHRLWYILYSCDDCMLPGVGWNWPVTSYSW